MNTNAISSLHIIGGKGLGGAELFYTRLVNALHAHGQPTVALTVRKGRVSAELRGGLVQEHAPMLAVWDLFSKRRIAGIIRKHQPDIVQTYMGRATRLTRLPLGPRPVHVARLGGYYNLEGYRHAHAWVGNTKGICDYLLKGGLSPERVCYIGNFVSIPAPEPPDARQELRRQFHIPDEALVVVGVGRLHPVKGFEDLLKAFATVPTAIHHHPLYLVIVGDGPLNAKLKQYATELGIDERLRWAGWRTDAGRFYDLADVFVCPSRYETLGNVVLEAWAHRRPVIATRTAGPLELATHEEDAWLVPKEDPAALAESIEKLLKNETLRDGLAEKGCRNVVDHHSQEAVVGAYLDFYSRLLRA